MSFFLCVYVFRSLYRLIRGLLHHLTCGSMSRGMPVIMCPNMWGCMSPDLWMIVSPGDAINVEHRKSSL